MKQADSQHSLHSLASDDELEKERLDQARDLLQERLGLPDQAGYLSQGENDEPQPPLDEASMPCFRYNIPWNLAPTHLLPHMWPNWSLLQYMGALPGDNE